MNNKALPKSHELIELSIAQERLQQARYSFNLALAAIALSFSISFVGAVLLLCGQVAEGAVTSACGLVSSFQSAKLAREANERLDKIFAELED